MPKFGLNKISVVLLVTLLLGMGCDKDSVNGPRPREPRFDFKNECRPFGPATTQIGFSIYTVDTAFDQPRFNPHNADELLYHEVTSEYSRLVKYTISTGEKRTFLEPVSRTIEVDWGRGGWIAFSDYGDVHLIKEDGTGLHKVPLSTVGHSCAEPDWNPDGTVVGFPFGGVDGLGLYGMYLLYDITQQKLDTFDSYAKVLFFARPLAWSINNKMTIGYRDESSQKSKGIGYVDMESKESELTFAYNDMKWDVAFGSGDVQWDNSGNSVYFTGGNLMCYSTKEYLETRIKKGCQSRYYEDITISPDNKKIVVERVNVCRPRRFRDILEERHQLYIMDIDGCDERPLFDED